MVGQASSLSISKDGQDARHHQILFFLAIILENPYIRLPGRSVRPGLVIGTPLKACPRENGAQGKQSPVIPVKRGAGIQFFCSRSFEGFLSPK
jgi:hypothetical protein